MQKSRLVATLIFGLLSTIACMERAAADVELTTLERKWLRAGWPVLTYAEQQQMPVDIVVQPDAKSDTAPLSASVAAGRCQLVLTMRQGDADANVEGILASLPAELHTIAIEAMVAHELAHCWRYLNGMWHTVPANFVDSAATADAGSDRAALRRNMRDTRREEGFADLVGLAWTLREHPRHYAAIHAWFERVRAEQPVTGSFHDTRVWLRLAGQPDAFAPAATPFEQARQLWARGLTQD